MYMTTEKIKNSLIFLLIILLISFITTTTSSFAADNSLKGIAIKVTDSSSQSIPPYENYTDGSLNNILNPEIILSADAQAHFSYNLTNVTFSKYKFVKAADLNVLPKFPQDSEMVPLDLKVTNTEEAYESDLGDQGYLTAKHYIYNGKAGTAADRLISFGTAVTNGDSLIQRAVIGKDINENQGLNSNAFMFDDTNSNNNKIYSSTKTGLFTNLLSETVNNTTTNYWCKYAAFKAMKVWGYFKPKRTGSYLLGVYSDDGAYGKISVGNEDKVFVNDWRIAAPIFRATPTGTNPDTAVSKTAQLPGIYLEENHYYPIYFEWYEGKATQGAFVPQYLYNSDRNHKFIINNDGSGINNNSTVSHYAIPADEFYASYTNTPGQQSSAYFGDVSGLNFPVEDGYYYIASKFISSEGSKKGFYGPFDIDKTKPTITDLSVTTDNSNNKLARKTSILTVRFKASEKLKVDPQVLINGCNPKWLSSTKDSQNYYVKTIKISDSNTITTFENITNIQLEKTLNQGAIKVEIDHYSDLSGNEGDKIQDTTTVYDSISPSASIIYSANPVGEGYEKITVKYSEPLKANEVPQISINQPGSMDITSEPMTIGEDTTEWTYNYQVHKDDGSNYKDGTVIVSLSTVKDPAGNDSNPPAGNSFIISTINPYVTVGFSKNPTCAGLEKITVTYSTPVKAGEIPKISINQPGTYDILSDNMTNESENKIWSYNYTVNQANGSTYIDGIAKVSLSVNHNDLNKEFQQQSEYPFVIDTKGPSVDLNCNPANAKEGQEIVTVKYSEPVKDGITPLISIDQQGSLDIVSDPMQVGADRSIWRYNYNVKKDNGAAYKDGIARVTLSSITDEAGNTSAPANASFIIDTTPPSVSIDGPLASKDSTVKLLEGKNGGLNKVCFNVTFSEAASIDLSKFGLEKSGELSANIGDIVGFGNTKTVYVEGISGIGTLNLKILENAVLDLAGNGNSMIASDQLVINTPVESVTLESPVYLKTGATKTLIADVKPNELVNKNVTWMSSNPIAASVDNAGLVTAGSVRNIDGVDITATTVDTDKAGNHCKAISSVKIIDPYIISSIYKNKPQTNIWKTINLEARGHEGQSSELSPVGQDIIDSSVTYLWEIVTIPDITPGTAGSGKLKNQNLKQCTINGTKKGSVRIKLTVTANALDNIKVSNSYYTDVTFTSSDLTVN